MCFLVSTLLFDATNRYIHSGAVHIFSYMKAELLCFNDRLALRGKQNPVASPAAASGI